MVAEGVFWLQCVAAQLGWGTLHVGVVVADVVAVFLAVVAVAAVDAAVVVEVAAAVAATAPAVSVAVAAAEVTVAAALVVPKAAKVQSSNKTQLGRATSALHHTRSDVSVRIIRLLRTFTMHTCLSCNAWIEKTNHLCSLRFIFVLSYFQSVFWCCTRIQIT